MSATETLLPTAHAAATKLLAEHEVRADRELRHILVRAWYYGFVAGFDRAVETIAEKATA